MKRAVPLLTLSVLTSAVAGPPSSLISASFIDGAVLVTGAPELAEFAGTLRQVASGVGGTCQKSEYVTWDSAAGLEAQFQRGLATLGYAYAALKTSDDGGHFVAFQATKAASTLVGVWADSDGTTLLGWCALKTAQAAAPAKVPAALTPTAPAKPPARPAAPAPAPQAAKPPAPPVKAPAAKRGYVSGVVLDTQGRPLAGADVYIWGTTFTQGQRTEFNVQTGRDGTYSIRVPDGRYRAEAKLTRDFAGATFELPLHPASGTDRTEVDSTQGGTLNFRWQLTGAKPGGGSDWMNFYGASVEFSYCGLPARAYCNEKYADVIRGAAPGGSTVTLTFTPQGTLVDGTAGKPVVMTFRAAELAPPGGYPYVDPNGGGRTVLGQGWPYHSQNVNDLPLGLYTLSVVATTPDGRRVPMKVGLEEQDVEHASVTLKWSAYDITKGLKQLRVYVRD